MIIKILPKKYQVNNIYIYTIFIIISLLGICTIFSSNLFIPCWIISLGIFCIYIKILKKDFVYIILIWSIFGILFLNKIIQSQEMKSDYDIFCIYVFLWIQGTFISILFINLLCLILNVYLYSVLSFYYNIEFVF